MENEEEYSGYVIGCSVHEEAERVSQDGIFAGPLGDTMVPALSNALGLTMFIISSIPDHPVISVLPSKSKFHSIFILHLHIVDRDIMMES